MAMMADDRWAGAPLFWVVLPCGHTHGLCNQLDGTRGQYGADLPVWPCRICGHADARDDPAAVQFWVDRGRGPERLEEGDDGR
jgi:hypothetical protein